MDKFRKLYAEFCELSVQYLERETGARADAVDVDTDVDTLLSLVPMLEKKVCPLTPALRDEQLLLFMKYFDFQVLSFWFLRSGAVVKSLYNKLRDEPARAAFRALFRELLLSTQTLVALNSMYQNLHKDTADILDDSRKILEIVAQVRATHGEAQAYRLLASNYNFIVKLANKVLSDENYLLKLVAVFNTDLVHDRARLEEYRELFAVSTEHAAHGIRCLSEVDVERVEAASNRYTAFFRRVLGSVRLFQTRGLSAPRFVAVVSKIYLLVYQELTQNGALADLLAAVLDSLKQHVSVEELRRRQVKNLQALVRYIAEHKTLYRELLAREYERHEPALVALLQEVAERNGVRYREQPVDVPALVRELRENVFARMARAAREEEAGGEGAGSTPDREEACASGARQGAESPSADVLGGEDCEADVSSLSSVSLSSSSSAESDSDDACRAEPALPKVKS
ncbi:virion morphogenesis core protein [Equine molluscum contagiosum-like virus]|nr:virion morphogenesis core protein [Equine molluscum contagiosum-like virus]